MATICSYFGFHTVRQYTYLHLSTASQSYTTSIASSVQAYPFVHGRRFHAYREGTYQFPNDEQEQDRLDMVHALHSVIKDDKLFLAPVTPKRVLDVGTGTGLWAVLVGECLTALKSQEPEKC